MSFITKQKQIVNPINIMLEFIIKNYPASVYPKVLEVAAGRGKLSERLSDVGYDVTIIDPETKKDDLPKNINVKNYYFELDTDISEFDLGIAVFPHSVHENFIRNFTLNEKSFLIVPSKFDLNGENIYCNSAEEWNDFLYRLNPNMNSIDMFKDSNVSFISSLPVLYVKK